MRKHLWVIFSLVILTATLYGCGGHSHTMTKIDYKAATCTEDGNVEYWYCSFCEKKFSDEKGKQEISDIIIPATGHHLVGKDYDYVEKNYTLHCDKCDYNEIALAGKTEDLPLLARNEVELAEIVATAEEKCFIKLANDIEITTGMYAVVLRISNGGTLDLGGYTVKVKNNGGFVIEGTNVVVQNGNIITDYENPKEGYALFIGDEGAENFVTIKNVHAKGGFNVYNCVATLYGCEVDSSQHTYYALWADEHSTINVESGKYIGGEIACVHSTVGELVDEEDGRGIIKIFGGEFVGDIKATDLTIISGGQFDGKIKVTNYAKNEQVYLGRLVVSKNYKDTLNIVSDSANYTLASYIDSDGNTVYTTIEK